MATNTRSLRKRKEPDGVTSSMAIPNPPKKVKSEAAEKTPKKQAAAKKQETTKKQAETTKKQATTKRKAEPLALAKEAPEGLSLTSRTPKVPEAASQGPVIKRAPSLNDVEYFKHKSTLHRQLEYGFKHIATLAPDLRVGVGCSKEAADAVKKEDRVGVTISQVSGEAIAGLFADLRTGVWNLLKSKFVDEELEALTSPIIKKLSEISPKARGFSSHAGRGTMVIEGIIWKRLQSLIFDRKSADWYKKDPWIPLEASFKAAKDKIKEEEEYEKYPEHHALAARTATYLGQPQLRAYTLPTVEQSVETADQIFMRGVYHLIRKDDIGRELAAAESANLTVLAAEIEQLLRESPLHWELVWLPESTTQAARQNGHGFLFQEELMHARSHKVSDEFDGNTVMLVISPALVSYDYSDLGNNKSRKVWKKMEVVVS